MDPVTTAAGHLLESLERAGGYAALAGLVLVGVFVLTTYLLRDMRVAATRREMEANQRHADSLRRADEALARERDNSGEHQRRTDRVIDVVESNTKALTTLVVASSRQDDVLNRIDRHLGDTAAKQRLAKTPRGAETGGE